MAQPNNIRIGGFETVRRLPNPGGQGVVYEARCIAPQFEDVAVGALVVLKVMSPHDPDGGVLRRLQQRTAALVRIRHPNIVRYYGCFSEEREFSTIHVVVMDYLRGYTLRELLDQNPRGLDADVVLRVIRASLCALVHACEKYQIIHRDLKPGNIFVCEDGTAKLIDFELARQEGGGVTVSSQGNMHGSYDYMAPDFLDADFRGDEQSDVFSLAVCLHEALSGRTPYARVSGDLRQASFFFHDRWRPLDATAPGDVIKISQTACRPVAHVQGVLRKGLSPNRSERFATFRAFEEAFQPVKVRAISTATEQYDLLHLVGQGGFGEVFKARRASDGRVVAIKHLLKAEYAGRFIREAKIIQDFADSRLVSFVDFFKVQQIEGEQFFLVMAYLPGMPGNSVSDRLRDTKQGLPFEEALRGFVRFAEGLAILHRSEVYHRDIKPSNLYLPQGHSEQACVMDMGVARDAKGSLTLGSVPGTLDFMPPEVAFGDSRGDTGMDIYALGLCLYEALTALPALPRLPHGDAAVEAFITRARNKQKPVFDHPMVTANFRLHSLLVRMTDPDAARREQDVRNVAEALKELLPYVAVSGRGQEAQPCVVVGSERATAGLQAPEAQPERMPDDAGAVTELPQLGSVARTDPSAQQADVVFDEAKSRFLDIAGEPGKDQNFVAPAQQEAARPPTTETEATTAPGAFRADRPASSLTPQTEATTAPGAFLGESNPQDESTRPGPVFDGESQAGGIVVETDSAGTGFFDPSTRKPSGAEECMQLPLIRAESGKKTVIANGDSQYELLDCVGRSGFGEVFKARRLADDRPVAIKHLLRTEYAAWFAREAERSRTLSVSASRLFVPVIEAFTCQVDALEGEHGFLIMDYLPGMPGNALSQRLEATRSWVSDRPATTEVLRGFARFAEGLAALHGQGLFHCAIRPSNLYLPKGSPNSACLMDLGGAYDGSDLLTFGCLNGTLDYLPPEVADGQTTAHASADIYALGLCLYEALTAERALDPLPVGKEAMWEFKKRAADKHLRKPIFIRERLGRPEIYDLLVRMTDPDVACRESSAQRVVETLTALFAASEPSTSGRKTAPRTKTKQAVPAAVPTPVPAPKPKKEAVPAVVPTPVPAPTKPKEEAPPSLSPVPKKARSPVDVRTLRQMAAVLILMAVVGMAVAYGWFCWKANQYEREKKHALRYLKSVTKAAKPAEFVALTNTVMIELHNCGKRLSPFTNGLPPKAAVSRQTEIEAVVAAYEAKLKDLALDAEEKANDCYKDASDAYGRNDQEALSAGDKKYAAWTNWVDTLGSTKRDGKALEDQRKTCEQAIAWEEERNKAEEGLADALKNTEGLVTSADAQAISKGIETITNAVAQAKSYKVDTGKAKAREADLRKRLVEITRLVRLTVRQAEYALKAFYDDGSGVDKEIPEAGIEVKPGKGRVTFSRLDHTRTNPRDVEIAINADRAISPPAAKEWLLYETEAKQKLTRLEKALGVTDPDWPEAAKMSQAIKATDLQDEKNKESLAALQKKIDDFWERNGKVVAAEKKVLDAIERLHLCEVALENGKGYQIPPKGTEDSRKDNRFEEKRSAWEARLTNWIATVACADAPLDTRAKRLSEGLTFLTNSVVHDLLAAIPREDAVERTKKAQSIFVLCVTNKSGQKIDVVAGDNHKEIADAGGWTVRLPATAETLSVEAKAARCLPKTNNVFLMAGGGTTVVVKDFTQKLEEGRLKVVGWEALDPPADLTVKPTAGGSVTKVKKNGETPLPFSKYILTGIRPDYENVNKPVVIDSEAIREVDLSANEWKPGKALSALLAAETAWDRERTVAAAKAYADVGELTCEGHKDRKVKLKEKIETHFDVEGKKYVSELQKARREQELWVFQVADPDKGPESRKDVKDVKDPIPADLRPFYAEDYVSGKVKVEIDAAWKDEPSVPPKVRAAHEDDSSFRDLFPSEPVKLLAEAVGPNYVPNKYDVALAKYMYKKCFDRRAALKIMEDEKRKEIRPYDENGITNWQANVDVNDANLAKVVNNLKVITKAFENGK